MRVTENKMNKMLKKIWEGDGSIYIAFGKCPHCGKMLSIREVKKGYEVGKAKLGGFTKWVR